MIEWFGMIEIISYGTMIVITKMKLDEEYFLWLS